MVGDALISAKKAIISFIIFLIPIMITTGLEMLGTTADITIGGLIGLAGKFIIDYLKERG